jgi:hypothetical protein
LDDALTEDQRLVLNTQAEVIKKTVEAIAVGGEMTSGQRAIIEEAGGIITATVNAIATGGNLTEDQRVIMDAIAGTSNRTVTISGGLTWSPDIATRDIWNRMDERLDSLVKEAIRARIANGYSEGGYTGDGGKYEPAGIVHKGEVVWSQSDIARAGGVSIVEAMRNGMTASTLDMSSSNVPTFRQMPVDNSTRQTDNSELVNELRAVRSELYEMKAASLSTARNAHLTRKQLERWDGDGLPETREGMETSVIL